MRVARSFALAALLLVAAGLAHGAEGAGGTLDSTKQELKQLQSDQKSKTGQSGDKLRLDAPTLDLQPEAGSPEAWLASKLKKERKLKEREQGNTNSNWLVEGVEKLEKEENAAKGAGNSAPAKGTATTETTPHPADQSDSQYLLKLFDEQKKPADNKSAAAKSSTTGAPDAFAPFMQSWLGSSPARGQFFDQFAKKPDGGGEGAPAAASNYRGPSHSATAVVVAPEPVVAEKGNPYLTELNAPVLTREVMNDTSLLQSMGTPMLAPEAARGGGPVVVPVEPARDAREREKAPLPGLADDKKYFPQLKRF